MCKHMVDRAINLLIAEALSADWACDRTEACMNLECFTDVSSSGIVGFLSFRLGDPALTRDPVPARRRVDDQQPAACSIVRSDSGSVSC